MGGQLVAQVGGLPCPPLPDAILQASRGEEGGENQVGGAWGRLEAGGYQQSFYFHKNKVKVKVFTLFHQISEHLCAVDWRACPMYHFSAGLEGTR